MNEKEREKITLESCYWLRFGVKSAIKVLETPEIFIGDYTKIRNSVKRLKAYLKALDVDHRKFFKKAKQK